jgi:hypothetical protein
MERAGLVVKRRAGREQLVSGNPGVLNEAHRFLEKLEGVWRNRIDRIDEMLAEPRKGSRK